MILKSENLRTREGECFMKHGRRFFTSVVVLMMTTVVGFWCLTQRVEQKERLKVLQPLKVKGGILLDERGNLVKLFGVNLFESHLGWVMEQDIVEMERNLRAIAALGFNAIRVPLNMSYIEPAPDVFPDDHRYEDVMRQHRLKPNFPKFLDELVRVAGELGLYVVWEFHELPADPWRYFAGGDEQLRKTGKHGGAISWMAKITYRQDGTIEHVELDWDKAFEHVPKALAWLARRYKGNSTVAAIEVPWNEPVGGLADDENAYFRLVQACARAVKRIDPQRLVFMNVQDWGAGINFLPPSSCWRVPDEVDALFPHFYFGIHCPNMPYEAALQIAAAHWVSWFLAWGKPVLIGEYGTAGLNWESWLKRNKEVLTRRYQLFGDNPNRKAFYADVVRACLEQWLKMGVDGVFYWAWWGGIPGQEVGQRTYTLTHGLEILKEFALKFKEAKVKAVDAKVVVVCDKGRRAQYGDLHNLAEISQILVEANATPYHVVFSEAIMAERRWLYQLRRYEKVVVLTDGLQDEALTKMRLVVQPSRLILVTQKEHNWREQLVSSLN